MQRLLQSLQRIRRSPLPRAPFRSSPSPPSPPHISPHFASPWLHHPSSPSLVVKRLFSITHLLISPQELRDRGVRLFQFSLQRRRTHLGNAFLGYRRGWRSFMSSPDSVLYGLIGANVAVFMLWRLADPIFMEKNFMISVANVTSWRLHTLITSAFSHIDTDHIFTNMIGLYFFGSSIGTLFGGQFLLKMYIAGALGGSIFYVIHGLVPPSFKGSGARYRSSVPGLGASGAVNAIMLFYIFLFPRNTIYLQFFFPVPAALMGAFLIGSDLWRLKQGDTRVSGSAHLGGAVVAALVWARMVKHWI